MRFYGIADVNLDEVNHWYATLEEAQEERRKMIGDEPEWVETMHVVIVDLGGSEPVVEPIA